MMMHYKLLALPIAVTASLRGPILQSDQITRHFHGLSLPPPDRACLSQSEADGCTASTDANDKTCVWCAEPRSEYEGSGLCLSVKDVVVASEFVGVPCGLYDSHIEGANDVEEGLVDEVKVMEADGRDEDESKEDLTDVLVAVPDFSCFSQAWGGGDIDLCHNSKAADGSQCQWCTTSDELIEVGVCITLAQVSDASKAGLSCPSDIEIQNEEEPEESSLDSPQLHDTLPDINCFRAAWIADNAENACGTSQANDGSNCVWCQTKGDTMGACVSGSEATYANGQFGLTCPSDDGDMSDGTVELDDMKVIAEEDSIDLLDAV